MKTKQNKTKPIKNNNKKPQPTKQKKPKTIPTTQITGYIMRKD